MSLSPGPSPGASGTSEASRNASCRLRRPSRSGAAWWWPSRGAPATPARRAPRSGCGPRRGRGARAGPRPARGSPRRRSSGAGRRWRRSPGPAPRRCRGRTRASGAACVMPPAWHPRRAMCVEGPGAVACSGPICRVGRLCGPGGISGTRRWLSRRDLTSGDSVSHPHRPPLHQVVGSGPADRRSDDRLGEVCVVPVVADRRDWLPLAMAEAFFRLRGSRSPGRPRRTTTDHMEDPSARSCASTTGSGCPRSGSSAPTARPSASSASTTPCDSRRRPTSTSSRSRRPRDRRSASSWTTASSSTRTPRRLARRVGTRRT